MMALAAQFNLNGLEKPRQIKLISEPFSVDNGILTPTFKMMRRMAQERFKEDIPKLYAMPRFIETKASKKI